jgi:hypothetical protein
MAIRWSPEERARILYAARVKHQSMSEFVRLALAAAVSDCLDDDDDESESSR